MGSVWRAEHLVLNAPVAIKLLTETTEGGHSPETVLRFLREARSAANLRSPHVVQVMDHGVDPTTQLPFIVMELLEGESLAERLLREQRLSPEQTSRIFSQAARALARAHEAGIVHRDLKPANLFLVRNEDEEVLKVLDFGLARWTSGGAGADPGVVTITEQVLGTPYYMSPEQMSGGRSVDHRSDLWSLAVVAYECVTGTRPFQGDTVIAIALKVCGGALPELPEFLAPFPDLGVWFRRALAGDPAERFQSARDAAAALRRACGVEGSAVTLLEAEPREAAPVSDSLQGLAATSPLGASATLLTGAELAASAKPRPATTGSAHSVSTVASAVDATGLTPSSPRRWPQWLALGAATAFGVLVWLTLARSSGPPTGAASDSAAPSATVSAPVVPAELDSARRPAVAAPHSAPEPAVSASPLAPASSAAALVPTAAASAPAGVLPAPTASSSRAVGPPPRSASLPASPKDPPPRAVSSPSSAPRAPSPGSVLIEREPKF
jgi:eukaryotic-like serine/threonine-protein kinase